MAVSAVNVGGHHNHSPVVVLLAGVAVPVLHEGSQSGLQSGVCDSHFFLLSLCFLSESVAWGSDIHGLKMRTKWTLSKNIFVVYVTSNMSDLSVKPTRRKWGKIYKGLKG